MVELRQVIVTGASRGIGKAIAQKFAGLSQEQGYQVIATATSVDGVEHIMHYLEPYPVVDNKHQHKALVLDLSKTESIEAFYQHSAEQHINPTILINNAGITRDNLVLRMKQEAWSQVVGTNLSGTFAMTRRVLKSMLKAKWGRIINISSVVASRGNLGQANYAASKAGIEAFSRALALEVAGRNVTVNSVAPGFIVTDMTDGLSKEQKDSLLEQIPLNRFGDVKDIAEAVAFLASDQASYITGISLPVNGGMYMG